MDIKYDDEWDDSQIKNEKYEKYKDNFYLPDYLENKCKYMDDDKYWYYHNMTPRQRGTTHRHKS